VRLKVFRLYLSVATKGFTVEAMVLNRRSFMSVEILLIRLSVHQSSQSVFISLSVRNVDMELLSSFRD